MGLRITDEVVTIIRQRPPHEYVKERVLRAQNKRHLESLEEWLLNMALEKDHYEIIGMWNARCVELGYDPNPAADSLRVHARVIEEKRRAILEEADRVVKDIVNRHRED